MMKIIVISLPDSQDRRKNVSEKFDNRQIAFEFMDAVDGRTGNHPYLKNYDEKAFLINRRRKAAPGELGCYVSHLLAWERCIAIGAPIVVLEDDFELTDDFVEGLDFLENFLNDVAFVRLEPLESRFFVTSHRGEKFSLVKQIKIGMCATGYVITPHGAKALLENGKKIRFPVDLYLKFVFIHKQIIHALIPNIVHPTQFDSIIGLGIRSHREKGIILRIKRFIFKTSYLMINSTSNIINISRKF